MTYRIIHGIPFRVRSPSHYELSGAAYPSSSIDLCAVSFECDGAWHISVLFKRGHTIQKGPFASLNDAVAVLGLPQERRA